jgi:hypothetical protein
VNDESNAEIAEIAEAIQLTRSGRRSTRRRGAAPCKSATHSARHSRRFLRSLRSIFLSVFFVLSAAAGARAQDTHLLVITGVSGDDEHAKLFHQLATRFIDAAMKRDGVAAGNIIYLAEKPDADPTRIQGRSNKEGVAKAFADVAAKAKPNDEVYVLLFGHGSFDGKVASFNIPGPDLTAADYGRLLAKFSAERVVFVDTTSASGGFLPAVAGPGRVIVTATKTGGERLEPRFPEFFVQAYESDEADRDRNGRISVSEAFEYAKAQVAAAYQKAGTMQTEHAALDDGNDGKLAAMLFLGSTGRVAAGLDMNNPQVRDLVKERDTLEQQVAALRLRKSTMDPAQYDQELEKLLLALAQKTKALQALEVKKQ